MSLIPIDAEYHFVQDTTPPTANAGDVWLDTSQNPPVAKIYVDVGNGLEWLKDQASSRIDIPVSSAGASIADIEQGAEDALEEDISNMSPASNSVAGNLDGGIAAVDWSSKTPKFSAFETTVNGSGYIIGLFINSTSSNEYLNFGLTVDGTTLAAEYINSKSSVPLFYRFESSFSLTFGAIGDATKAGVSYVLD